MLLFFFFFSGTAIFHHNYHYYQAYAGPGEVTIIAKLSNNFSNEDKTVSVVLFGPNGIQLMQSEPTTLHKGNETTTVTHSTAKPNSHRLRI